MLRFIPSILGVLLLSLPLTLLSQTSCITVEFLPDFFLNEELEVFVVAEPAFIEGPSSVMVSPNTPTAATFCIPYGSTDCMMSFTWLCGVDSVLIATTVSGGPAGALLEDVEITMIVTCSDIVEWDCPNLMGDVGMPCQDGWGVITEDCECVEDTTGGGGGNLNCLDGLDLGALMMYLMEACGNQDNPDSWWYCGLMETMNAAMAGDQEACDEVWAWIDTGEWGGEVPCGINFEVMQAWEANGELIPNELWVWIYDYDSEYTYTWDFGDESPATSDPFPTYTYGTDGPYELCVTVSSVEDSCSSVYCETVEVDSDGMIVGMMSGFTINVMGAGEPLSVGSVSQEIQHLEVYPNPVEGSELQINWSGLQSGVNKIELMTLDGVVVRRLDVHRDAGGHSLLMNVDDLSAGMYFLRMTQGIELRTKKVVIR
ncbi:MAG: T9SS type A sorting domain-containing protein [Flavobacteriales bacterium]|nr:T9SS type A sorting domain-containing protein [Flavobacteriales bacterium]